MPQKARVGGSPKTLPTEAENSRQTLVHGQLWELLIVIISPLFLSNTSHEVSLTTHLALLTCKDSPVMPQNSDPQKPDYQPIGPRITTPITGL